MEDSYNKVKNLLDNLHISYDAYDVINPKHGLEHKITLFYKRIKIAIFCYIDDYPGITLIAYVDPSLKYNNTNILARCEAAYEYDLYIPDPQIELVNCDDKVCLGYDIPWGPLTCESLKYNIDTLGKTTIDLRSCLQNRGLYLPYL